MARNRPEYRAPLRDYPKKAGAGFEAMLKKRTSFGDFSPESGRRQCKAVKRGENRQCCGTAINGSDYCHAHKGRLDLNKLVKQFHPNAVVLVKDGKLARRYYAGIAFSDECGMEIPASVRKTLRNEHVGARGRKFEEWLNKKKT